MPNLVARISRTQYKGKGWDVKNVYVIASLRASISDILTEQTLGRGLRLPFGEYTGVEILDTLEVLAHERYEDLLKKSHVLNEAFIDQRTRAVLRTNAMGEQVAALETTSGFTPDVSVGAECARGGNGRAVRGAYGSRSNGGAGEANPNEHGDAHRSGRGRSALRGRIGAS